MTNKTKQEMLSELMKVETRIGGYKGLKWLKARGVEEIRDIYEAVKKVGIIEGGKN